MTDRLQRLWLTRWYWRYYQHEDTGRITVLPFWKNPGARWRRFNCKE